MRDGHISHTSRKQYGSRNIHIAFPHSSVPVPSSFLAFDGTIDHGLRSLHSHSALYQIAIEPAVACTEWLPAASTSPASVHRSSRMRRQIDMRPPSSPSILPLACTLESCLVWSEIHSCQSSIVSNLLQAVARSLLLSETALYSSHA